MVVFPCVLYRREENDLADQAWYCTQSLSISPAAGFFKGGCGRICSHA